MRFSPPLLMPLALAGAFGCAAGARPEASTGRPVPPAATARMVNGQGQPIGTVSVVQSKFGGLLVLKLAGVPPGTHGLHLHTAGVCEPPTFASAGPHLNPAGREHGARNPKGPHLGDLPNVTARADGTIDTSLALRTELLGADVIGSGATARALVLHARADDMSTDPSGNSGDRIACGVLGR
jgi:Cu-Zn family superoxide dismutase